ncbi:MAG: tryptophan-rich sensory protein [Oscillospiraceae bacterium]|nr:tryptophan-rich sensory protein [Oscillospiraceae bacterium]
MKIQWKKLIFCIAIPLAVGGIAALLTREGMLSFEDVIKPPLTPPAWLFPLCWTVLYVLMGVASYLVAVSDDDLRGNALVFYGVQLILNFFWPLLFFNLAAYLFSFIWLVILWAIILVTMLKFYKISERAGDLMLPYILWVTFAGYLNFGIYMLNRG